MNTRHSIVILLVIAVIAAAYFSNQATPPPGAAGSSARPAPEACAVAGQADGHVLALSWQPGFCETNRRKPECRDNTENPPAYEFSLHGLWPNKDSCGTRYGYCGPVKSSDKGFCNLPPVPLAPATQAALAQVMPSAEAGSCLERHEWHKHGTCQTQWDADEYYRLSIRLTEEFNHPALVAFIRDHYGATVEVKDFHQTVDEAFGKEASKRLRLGCKKGNLVDVYLALPAVIPATETLPRLIQDAESVDHGNCGARFKLDAAGYE
ncbi:MAG: ribonuclease T [Pseudomonadota bacterium]